MLWRSQSMTAVHKHVDAVQGVDDMQLPYVTLHATFTWQQAKL